MGNTTKTKFLPQYKGAIESLRAKAGKLSRKSFLDAVKGIGTRFGISTLEVLDDIRPLEETNGKSIKAMRARAMGAQENDKPMPVKALRDKAIEANKNDRKKRK